MSVAKFSTLILISKPKIHLSVEKRIFDQMQVEKVYYPSGRDCYKCCNHGAKYYSEFVGSSSFGNLNLLVCVHMLTLEIQMSNESCSYDKYSMELDLSLELLSVKVCIVMSVFAVTDMVTLSQTSHHYFCRQFHDP